MLKLEMRLNEEQIIKDAKYEPEKIKAALDKAFSKYKFKSEVMNDGAICFYGNGTAKDYGIFGRLITSLKDKDWVTPYLDKWLWYNSDDGENEADFSVEDVLYHYAKRESVN